MYEIVCQYEKTFINNYQFSPTGIKMMIRESEIPKGLPKKTQSLCPECLEIIQAEIRDENGKVIMIKECKEHGEFKDVIWSNVDMYLMAERYAYDGVGVENPLITKKNVRCPDDCGLCILHKSHTSLANIDLTNRCNLVCPICFANANTAGYVYEPSYEQIVDMLRILRAEKPVPCQAVQFAGGEPTIHPDYFRIVEAARDLGFAQIQVATNGIKFAESMEFTQKNIDSGMHTVYLQFDGIDEEIYISTRGVELFHVKEKAIQHIRNTEKGMMSVCLVPTIVNTINDHVVGEIVEYAVKNCDVIHAVNFQPVAFTGRISKKELARQRFTLPDLVDRIKTQTNYGLEYKDFYTVPAMAILSELISLLKSEPLVTFTPHPHCGIGTFIFVDESGNVHPVTKFIKVKDLLDDALKMAKEIERSRAKRMTKIKVLTKIAASKLSKKYILKENVPKGVDPVELLKPLFADGDKKALSKFTWNAIMIGGMHFQDAYNYDIERVMRCCIHYATPDGRIIPFCAYNGGPTYRNEIEKKFSIPVKEWLEKNPGKNLVEPSSIVKIKPTS